MTTKLKFTDCLLDSIKKKKNKKKKTKKKNNNKEEICFLWA